MLKKLIVIVILILLIVAGIRLIKYKKAAIGQAQTPVERLMAVKTAPVEHGEFAITKTRLGEIIAKHQALLAARITSHILTVSGRAGTMVRKGDLLIQLDDRLQKDRVASTRSDLAAAKTQLATQRAIFSRDRKLVKAQAISREAFDQSRANHDNAAARVTALQNALNSALADLSYTVIKAPANGVISRRLVDPGDLAVPGKTLMQIEETGAGYYIKVNLPQADFSRLAPGDPVTIIPDNLASSPAPAALTATISRIHPTVSQGTLTSLEIDLDKHPFHLPTGATVRVSLVEQRVKGWKIPARAILENVKDNFVFAVAPDSLVQVIPTRILASNGDWLVVAAELKEKSRLIIAQESSLLRLHDQQEVKVVQ